MQRRAFFTFSDQKPEEAVADSGMPEQLIAQSNNLQYPQKARFGCANT